MPCAVATNKTVMRTLSEGFFSSKNECDFVGGVSASVTKRYIGVGGSLKHQNKA